MSLTESSEIIHPEDEEASFEFQFQPAGEKCHLNAIDPLALARALNAWFAAKDLGTKGKLGRIITLCHQQTGQPIAQRTYSGKKPTVNFASPNTS